jgi:hypothetical protein
MWRLAAAFFAGMLAFGSAAPAFAQGEGPVDAERRRFDDRPFSFAAVVGLGTLVGEAGFTLGYELDDRVAIGAGIGTNLMGWMGGPYVRFRPVVGMTRKARRLYAFSIDTGLSIGPYVNAAVGLASSGGLHEYGAPEPQRLGHDTVAWLQLEPSWETQSASGMTIRTGVGWSVLLTPDAVACEGPLDGDPCGPPVPVVGVVTFAIGFAG